MRPGGLLVRRGGLLVRGVGRLVCPGGRLLRERGVRLHRQGALRCGGGRARAVAHQVAQDAGLPVALRAGAGPAAGLSGSADGPGQVSVTVTLVHAHV
ncbi:hypothetical protein GCM10017750_36040 [Streptomyces racemochromogenes]